MSRESRLTVVDLRDVKVENTEAPVLNTDAGIASSLLPQEASAGGQDVVGHGVSEAPTFQFDENTLKSLQQFMDSQAFQATSNVRFLLHICTSRLTGRLIRRRRNRGQVWPRRLHSIICRLD